MTEMNIFEQYGGYEVVKQTISNYKKSGDMVTAAGLELRCLEYRRKHNIFEVGDLVTYKAYFKGLWREGFGKITEIDEDLEAVNIDDSVGVSISEIEHASDEEIKAGRRL